MVKVSTHGQMVRVMTVNGRIIYAMGWVLKLSWKEIHMRDHGLRGNTKGMVLWRGPMVEFMTANGRRTWVMDMVSHYWWMERNMKGHGNMVSMMVMGLWRKKTELSTKGSGNRIKDMVRENIIFLMVMYLKGNSMKMI
jgi:hypothetical protein